MSDDLYEAWISERRAATPPDEMPDQVMRSIEQLQSKQKQAVAARLVAWIERSRLGRYAACSVAMLIGSTPFLTYFAYLMVV